MRCGWRLTGAKVLIAWAVLASPPVTSGEAMSVDFSGAIEAAEGLPRIHSLLVSSHGELILERYFNGARANRPANIKSASKSVISALVGIAIDQGLIADVNTPISKFFPELLNGDEDPDKRLITVEDLLTMRAGLEPTSGRNYGSWVQSGNWVRYALTRPVVNLPGARMIYSTGNTHLLSAILTQVSGKSTWQFARDTLARPVGIDLQSWERDPQGIFLGGNNMTMTPRQMLAFGALYLNRGRANGRQIVPEDWVKASWIPRTRSRWSERLYGYGWWIGELSGYRAHFAWGYGGQLIFVVPDLELIVVTTSSSAPGQERRTHRRTVFDLVERLVINPLDPASTNKPLARDTSAISGTGSTLP